MATKRKKTRTTPTGIRFDLEKLSFILANEKLETRQGVVDFLMDSYWWKNKPPFDAPVKHIPPSKREVVEQVVKDSSKPVKEEKPKEEQKVPTSVIKFEELLEMAKNGASMEFVVEAIKANKAITPNQSDLIKRKVTVVTQ